MPFRIGPTSSKGTASGPLQADQAAKEAAKNSHGGLLPPPGTSHSRLPAGSMEKSRQRTNLGTNLGPIVDASDLRPIMLRAIIIIGTIVVLLTVLIYAVSQQVKFSKEKASKTAGDQNDAPITFPKGKKPTAQTMHQFLMKLAGRANDEGNFQAAARLYAHAAEEARLGGAPLSKQYIDALFAQGEVYQYSLNDSSRARPIFEKVLKLQQADSSTRPNKLANTLKDLADSLAPDNDATKARIQTLYAKAIALAKSANDQKDHAYFCYNAGEYYYDQSQYDKALSMANESLAAFAKTHEPDQIDVADSHYLAARALAHMPGSAKYEQANGEFETALKSYEQAEADEERYAQCMRDAAWNKLRLGQRTEAQELFDKASSHNDDDDVGNNSDNYMSEALK